MTCNIHHLPAQVCSKAAAKCTAFRTGWQSNLGQTGSSVSFPDPSVVNEIISKGLCNFYCNSSLDSYFPLTSTSPGKAPEVQMSLLAVCSKFRDTCITLPPAAGNEPKSGGGGELRVKSIEYVASYLFAFA